MTTTNIALITGANKGIGYATARELAARGMTVLVGARDAGRGREAVAALRAGGADAHPVPLEVTDPASVAAAARIVNVSSEVGSITAMTGPESFLWPVTSVPYPSSKTALNMVTAMYAKELRDTPILVNAANPGYCATDLNGSSGYRTPEQGAEVSVHLATLPADGPSGQLWGHLAADDSYGVLPW
ncbi:SDR family NAD(P)-dependent oxidoreductase [Micromonospora sp. CPCC 206171]|uniref:SDR family NAD(P)-dependent oxidoreductase n=1 Tax=Micromonospora sp. CPCC 206171 TaxID=3122405 RepID=UPI002FF2540F